MDQHAGRLLAIRYFLHRSAQKRERLGGATGKKVSPANTE